MRRLLVIATVLLTIPACSSDNQGIVGNDGTELALVSSEAMITNGTEVTLKIVADVTAGEEPLFVNGWPLADGRGPADFEFGFTGDVDVLEWAGIVTHTGTRINEGLLLVEAGETERFTLTVVVNRVAQPENLVDLGMELVAFRWHSAGDNFYVPIESSEFTTPPLPGADTNG